MAKLRESRWVYVLLSIILSIIFWLYVRASVDPNGVVSIHSVPVETTGTSVLTSQGLAISDISPQMVELRVEGSISARSDLIQERHNLSVIVDVSRCVEGENVLRCRPSWPEGFNEETVYVQGQEPSTVTVTVAKLYAQSFEVQFQLNGRVAMGYEMGTPAIEPETITVSGPVDQVNRIAKVAAILESAELNERFAGDLPLKLLDADGNELTDLEVTLSADTAYVVVPVVVTKAVELTVDVKAGGGATRENAEIHVEPSVLVVSGAETDLKGLDSISLGIIDLTDVVGTKAYTFNINLDPRFVNESGLTTATVTVTVEGLDTEPFATNNIRLINTEEDYTATAVTQSVLVMVRGTAEELAKVDASQIIAVVDLTGITTEGTQLVPVRVYLNGSSTVGVVGKYTISVNISR